MTTKFKFNISSNYNKIEFHLLDPIQSALQEETFDQ